MPFTPPPQDPNFKFGVGRISTDRYDFEAHLDGVNPPGYTNFRHDANQVDMTPLITINGQQPTNVQDAIALLAGGSGLGLATFTTPGIVQLSGDIGGNNNALNIFVSGLQGRPVSATIPTSGQALAWNGTSWTPQTIGGGGFTAGGDLSGTSSNQNVINIHGASVPIAGSLTIGNVLQVSGASSLTYAPVNLAGGSNYVSGVLPASNLPNLSGDVTGPITSNTVVKIQNNAVKSQILGLAQNGYVLTWVNPVSQWQALPGGGGGGGGITALITTGNPGGGSGLQESGDVTATGPGAVPGTVVGLQGWPISSATPSNNNLLVWNAAQNNWLPGQTNLSSGAAVTGVLPLANGGTNFANSSGTQYNVLTANASGNAQYGTVNLASTSAVGSSILPITNGGTGQSSVGSNNQVVTSNGSSWSLQFPTIGVQYAGGAVTQVSTLNFNTNLSGSIAGSTATINASGGGGGGGVQLETYGTGNVAGGPFTTLDFSILGGNSGIHWITNEGASVASIALPVWAQGGNASPSPRTLGTTDASRWDMIYNGATVMYLDNNNDVNFLAQTAYFQSSIGPSAIGTGVNKNFSLLTNNTTALTIDTAQLIGIGVAPTSPFRLAVQNSTISGTAIFGNNTNAGGGTGIEGQTNAVSGYGVYANNTATNGISLLGNSTNNVGPTAFFFNASTTGDATSNGLHTGWTTATGSSVIKATTGVTPIDASGSYANYLDCWCNSGSTHAGFLGGFAATGASALTIFTSSDRKLKENIIDTETGLKTLNKIKVRDFNMIADSGKTKIQGFIAQELHKIYPQAVMKGVNNNPWMVSAITLIPVMVKSIQDVSIKEKTLEKEIKSLHKKIAKLEAIIQKIK